ncbi:MAG: UbiD family decarboxylase [Planctomycetaceae bacterium]|jgi:4-hydroxy-3-polyprenylbenzoate decarboxylase|nr:UbiD family decarboxylase [Planctomycetaceae bacterium]
MGYFTLRSCVEELRRVGELVEFSGLVDPYLELAAVQRRLYLEGSPAVLFTNPKNCRFPMLSNLFGTERRLNFIFRDGIEPLRKAIELGADPISLLSNRINLKSTFSLGLTALSSFFYSFPKRVSRQRAPVLSCQTTLDQLPQLVSWSGDGGAYITLPMVYTEDPNRSGFGGSNLGMYRVQISGNDYLPNLEAGLHYQIHRGIAGHHAAALARGESLRVNVFIGGAPAMILAAVMPLPENVSELFFAGILGRHRVPMCADYTSSSSKISEAEHGKCSIAERLVHGRSLPPIPASVYAEADFCICGKLGSVMKREGAFGDHLGYYSLEHEFPVLEVESVWHRKDAIFPFTVVGRPPQEDTQFGRFIQNIVREVLPKKISGVSAIHAVDEAGVHPLLLAVGRESYVPFDKKKRAAELHTLAHAILGYGQLSLAKYLFIASGDDDSALDVFDVAGFLRHILLRVDWRRDVHFVTKTNMDTLDYSGYFEGELSRGSKMFVAVSGEPVRELSNSLELEIPCVNPCVVMPGVICVEEVLGLGNLRATDFPEGFPLIVIVDDAKETASSLRNFLWTTFTKSDPASDVYGVGEFSYNKHWGCEGALIINAKRKNHHAPELIESPEIKTRADNIVQKILKEHKGQK